ncbi:hypothetical protein N431DRAFT_478870 [Stipitochalara longipes BDJ]|nr:hypothetical protein N431DRAFT_478870 [Stipitochalara longipes BDJ]
MSLGWSARDIAQTLSLLVKLVRALDGADGAASEYREAVAFLKRLKRTLEPLQTLSALNLQAARREEIREAVEKIKEPVEKFLAITARFESSLGAYAQSKHHYQNVGRKLQWGFMASRKVNDLRKSIEGHVIVLNNLLQRLTLETIISMQSSLSGELQRVFTETLDPRLVSLLQEQLAAIDLKLVESGYKATQQHETIISKLESQETNLELLQTTQAELQISGWNMTERSEMLLSKLQEHELNQTVAIDKIKQHITSAIEELKTEPPDPPDPLGGNDRSRRQLAARRRAIPLDQSLQTLQSASDDELLRRDSLEEIYYLVLLYLGYFLRDLFITLSHKVRPVPALTPKLLAKHHISFHDILGRPPRVLDYDCFRSYTVFKAFLEDSFAKTPGSPWVEQGLYKLVDGKSNLAITPDSWSQMIIPGSHVIMSLFIEPFSFTATTCLTPFCRGTFRAKANSLSTICYKCGIEVIIPERVRKSGRGLIERIKKRFILRFGLPLHRPFVVFRNSMRGEHLHHQLYGPGYRERLEHERILMLL